MRVVFLSLFVACLGVPAAVADENGQKAHHLYEEGMKLYNVGDFAHALDDFKNGYLAKPDPAFLFNMGQCARMLGDVENEARHYRAFLRVNPDAPNRGDVLRFINDAEEELRRKAATRPPTGVEPLRAEPSRSAPVDTSPRAAPEPIAPTRAEPEPLVVATSEKADSKPLYRRPWLWVVVGAVVLAAVAAVIVAMVTPANASVPTTNLGAMPAHF